MILGFSAYDIAGFVGLVLYIGSYAALQMGLLSGQGYRYAILNTIAAGTVLASLVESFNFSAAMIETSWIAISVIGIARFYYLSHRVRFSAEEQDFLKAALPDLSRVKARKLLDLALWISGEPGAALTEEGTTPAHLIYLATGRAAVVSKGQTIAYCQPGSFIGELTVMTNEAATATVRLEQPARYMAIPAEDLRKLVRRDGDIRIHLENCFARHVRQKLVATNQAMLQRAPA